MSPAAAPGLDDFPRRHARTRRFTLGVPRVLAVSPDGARVVFLRSGGPEDPVTGLWVVDATTGTERVVVDPRTLDLDPADVTPEERARRERAREQASGVTTASFDAEVATAVCVLGSTAVLADLTGATPPQIVDLGEGAVVDPRLSPAGDRLAFVRGGALWVATAGGGDARPLVGSDEPDVTWGQAEFIAAEEMGRTRGFWWSPDGTEIAVARVDTTPVARWWIADPADPTAPPHALAYPAPGEANADVELWRVALDGTRTQVAIDAAAWAYLARVTWEQGRPLTVQLQARDQRRSAVATVDGDGALDVRSERFAPHWVELIDGTPTWAGDQLVEVIDDLDADARRLVVGGTALTAPGWQVRSVVRAESDAVWVTASGDDPAAVVALRVPLDGSDPDVVRPHDGVTSVAVGGETLVTTVRTLDDERVRVTVDGPSGTLPIASLAAATGVAVAPAVLRLGADDLVTALCLPSWHTPDSPPLPILCDPYGGPHAQRAVRSAVAHATSQYLAELGFAVLVADGRGSPGRGPAWERTMHGDLATPALDDQVAAVEALVAQRDDLDPGRVAIRGWSFGGYLAALAVLRRPDVFAAGIAGAPVTDWLRYDTHYTERYLGDPRHDTGPYERSSIVADAPSLTRPLLLIHGLADDNVVAAHTLALSGALLAAGRPHEVLPLANVTHMTPQEDVAAGLLHAQVDFLRRALGTVAPAAGR